MEENTNVTQEEEKEEVEATVETKEEPKAPEVDVQALMVELAKAKRDRDKASSEAADYKKKWKASLTEVEKASMEKAEKEAAREEEFQQLKRENEINRLEKQYMLLGFTADEAMRMAAAEADNDQESKIKIMAEVDGRKKKAYEAEFLASRPDVNIGGGSGKTVTKEQFDSMNPVELTALKRENPAEYDRLMGL